MNGPTTDILVMDDEQEITDLIKLYLEREGFTVHTTDNGQDAIRYAETLLPI